MFRKKSKFPIHWSRIEASAPGKFVLIGDFGDLYERNVIAIAIDKRLKVTIKPHEQEGMLRIHLKDFNETREWPTRLPIFSMTKLVANYADSLAYSEPTIQKLKPLLIEKYHLKTTKSQQQTSQFPVEGGEGLNGDGEQTSSGAEQQSAVQMSSNHQSMCLATSRGVGCNKATEAADRKSVDSSPNHDHGAGSINRDESAREQADKAILSFLLLYISLSDSFASSYRPSLDIEVESEIPMCRGLGSSTAFAVAMCTALMKVFRVSAEPTVIMDWTQTIDRFFHGEKSSLHSSVAIYGGYIYFQHGKIKSLGVPHQSPLKLMLIDTGVRRSPKLVNQVLFEKLAQKLDTISTVLNSVNELASQIWRRINDTDFMPSTIDDSLVVAQQSLDLLGVGHQRSHDILTLARQSHLTVKQSQAGETVFLLHDGLDDYENVRSFRKNLKSSGFKWLDQSISFDGFKVVATNTTNEEPFPQLQPRPL